MGSEKNQGFHGVSFKDLFDEDYKGEENSS